MYTGGTTGHLASYPGPKEEEKGPGTYCTRMRQLTPGFPGVTLLGFT